MEAKKYLQQVRKLNKMIQNKIIEIEECKDAVLGITGQTERERVQSSGNQQKMEDTICKYIDMQKELDADIDRLIGIKKEIMHTIESLPGTEYDVLHKIYIQGLEFTEIAERQSKSYSWVTTVHGRGLALVQKIIDERGQQSNEKKYITG